MTKALGKKPPHNANRHPDKDYPCCACGLHWRLALLEASEELEDIMNRPADKPCLNPWGVVQDIIKKMRVSAGVEK